MIQMKLKIYRYRLSLMLLAGISLFTFLGNVPVANAYHASDCSDVYTPLSSYVTDGVNNNKSFYVSVMNQTNVPWQMLAAIHYRETNFSHTNPSNGQGIFQFVNGAGGPYPPGPVSDSEFTRQLKFMANKIQTDYALRNSPNSADLTPRSLTANEANISLVKNTLYSYNGRATVYKNQASHFGYDGSARPYEGSPYVMNRFDCPRARMGIITRDYQTGIDSTDTRYGAFTVYARLKGDSYWKALTRNYAWQVALQRFYTDESMSTPAVTSPTRPGQRVFVLLKARNIGSYNWYKGGSYPVRLGTENPKDRSSSFCDTTWINCRRATGLEETQVSPGEVGTFKFWMKVTSKYGNFKEYFNLVAERKSWFNNVGMYVNYDITKPVYKWKFAGQDIYSDPARTSSVKNDTLATNKTYYLRLRAKNVGNTDWIRGTTKLGTSNPRDRSSNLMDSSWLSSNRAATIKEPVVKPGETGTFEFSIKTTSSTGTFKEYFRPVQEGKAWMNDVGQYWSLPVSGPTYKWRFAGQKLYDDPARTELNSGTVENNKTYYATLRATNVGNTDWNNSFIRLGTSNPRDRNSDFCDTGAWINCHRPTALKESVVKPGETGTFEFTLKTPIREDGFSIREYFQPVAEGKGWLNDVGQYYPMVFDSPDYKWQFAGQASFSDSNYSLPVSTSNLQTSTKYYLQLKAKNVGGKPWNDTFLRLGTSNPLDRTSQYYDNSWLAQNRATKINTPTVSPGQTATFRFAIRTPSAPSSGREYFQPVAEGKRWLNDVGQYWFIETN